MHVEHDRIADDSPQPWARVTRLRGTPDDVELAIELMRKHVMPATRRMEGWTGVLCLVSGSGDRATIVNFYESEAALVESSTGATRAKHGAAGLVTVTGVEEFQVRFHETTPESVDMPETAAEDVE